MRLPKGIGVWCEQLNALGADPQAMAGEEWRVVSWCPDYDVSNIGRVRRVRNVCRANSGRVMLPALTHGGYLAVNLRLRGQVKRRFVHRLVVEAFMGAVAQDLQVNHLNGVKTDNRAENLEIVTRSGNMAHAHSNGLMTTERPSCRGERNRQARLTERVVLQARGARQRGVLLRELAGEYGGTTAAIHAAVTGKNWKYLTTVQEEAR